MHPDGKAHGGAAILIKNNIKHFESNPFQKDEIQATTVVVEDWSSPITISAIYSPPKHAISKDSYVAFFKTLGHTFLTGGDFNAKHTMWGSRLITTKGRQLQLASQVLNLTIHSSGEPTYWPTDPNKIPDLIDFCITKGIRNENVRCESCLDLSSDHSPVLITLSRQILKCAKPCFLHNKHTDWNQFRRLISSTLNLQIPLKSDEDISDAVEHFNSCIQSAAWQSTPVLESRTAHKSYTPCNIREKLAEKRNARKLWQQSRCPTDKTRLNAITKELKNMLSDDRNSKVNKFLSNLGPTKATDYSLWKATKVLKRPILHNPPIQLPDKTWARSDSEKANAFAHYLENVFVPNNYDGLESDLSIIERSLNETYQLDMPIKKFSKGEVVKVITNLKSRKSPGYDLITSEVLKELPEIGIKFLTQLYNAILIRSFVPMQWKVSQIIMIPKPGKNVGEIKSYRPISLLPIPSKVLELLFLKRLNPIIQRNHLIPDHQFGFRQKHGTVEQIHRLVEQIHYAFEHKEYCTAAFLDISQAFDRVWHDGLLYKIRKLLPINYFLFIRSYLSDRHFFVKHGEYITNLFKIKAGVPQGSVMGPTLYNLFTSDFPQTEGTLIGTFADDTASLASDCNPTNAASKLQRSLDNISVWLKKWRIKANESKSVNVTFTLRKGICPPVDINGVLLPQEKEAKYLGMHLDSKLNWKKHIFTKRLALGLKLRSMSWLLNKKSQLSMYNKITLYKCILKPIWTYGIQLWGTAANSNTEILQRFQSKILRMICSAPPYIANTQLHRELELPTIKEEIALTATRYISRIHLHPNHLASNLMSSSSTFSRLRRRAPVQLGN